MKIKAQGVLAGLVVLVGIYAYYDYNKDQKSEMQKLEDSRLLTVNYEQIDQIHIQRGKEDIQLQRSVEGWELVSPLKDIADNEFVEKFIHQFVTDKILDVVPISASTDLAIYGLDKPLSRITLQSADGAQDIFEISEKRNFEENPFLRRNSEERVLVVGPTMLTQAKMTVKDFRDRHFVRKKLASLDELRLKNQKNSLRISQKDGQWVLSDNPEEALDQSKVREFLRGIAEARAAEFVSSSSWSTGKKLFTLELQMPDGIWRADVRQDKNLSIYAKVSEPDFVLKMEPGALDSLIQATAESLKEVRASAETTDKTSDKASAQPETFKMKEEHE